MEKFSWGIRGSNAFVLGKILLYSPADFTIGVVMKIVGFVLGVCALFVSCSPAPQGVVGTDGAGRSDPIPEREGSFIPWRSMNSYDSYGTKTASSKKSGTNINQYDRYGVKTGSLRETSDGYTSYDKYGVKTGSYKTTGSTITHYDKYGSKIGTYRTGSNGITTSYDKYGRKTGSFKEDSSGRITAYDKYGKKVGTMKQTH